MASHASGGHLAGAEQQVRVDLVEWLPGVRIEQRDGGGKEAFLVPSGGGAAVTAVAQISEMAQEFGGVLQARAIHVVFSSLCWGMRLVADARGPFELPMPATLRLGGAGSRLRDP